MATARVVQIVESWLTTPLDNHATGSNADIVLCTYLNAVKQTADRPNFAENFDNEGSPRVVFCRKAGREFEVRPLIERTRLNKA